MSSKAIASFITAIVIILTCPVSYAIKLPIDPKSIVATGGFTYDNPVDSDTDYLTVDVSASRFFIRGLSFGIAFKYSRTFYDDSDDLTSAGIGPLVRYYYVVDPERDKVTGSIFPYVGASILYNETTSSGSYYDNGVLISGTFKHSVTTYAAEFGGTFMAAKVAGIFGQVSYLYDSYKSGDWKTFHISGGLMFFIY